MKEYALMMLATVIAVRLLWIGPIVNALRMRPNIVMGVMNGDNEEGDDEDGN